MSALVNLFGVKAATAPTNPVGHLVWGFFRGINTALGFTPVARKTTIGTPDPSTGTITGTWGFTQPAGLEMTYGFFQATNGTVHVYTNGTFSYTPNESARQTATPTTTDSFIITAADSVTSTKLVVKVPILPAVVAAPIAGTPTISQPNNTTGTVTGALGFTDPGGKTLTYTVTTDPVKGSVTVTSAGNYSYTPTQTARQNAAADTTDTFTITATNGVKSATETVTVPVDAGNPQASTPTVGSADPETGTVAGNAAFTDPAGRTLSYSGPAGGVTSGGGIVSVNTTTGAFTYTPNASQRQVTATTDTFTIAADNGVNSATEAITVPVAATNHVTPAGPGIITGVGIDPTAVAISPNGGRLYVLNTGAVTVIDTTTNTVIDKVYVGSSSNIGPQAIAVNPNGSAVYVANLSEDTVSIINTATDDVTTISTWLPGNEIVSEPSAVVFSRDGSLAYVVNAGNAASIGASISVVNTANSNVTKIIPVDHLVDSVAVAGSTLYLSTYTGTGKTMVTAIDTVTGSAVDIAIPTPYGSGRLTVASSPDGHTVYVLHDGLDSKGYYAVVSAIDTTTTSVSGPFTISTTADFRDVGGIFVMSPDGTDFYVYGKAAGKRAVFKIDTATHTQVGSPIAQPNYYQGGLAVSPDGALAYVANLGTLGIDGDKPLISVIAV